MMAEGRQPDGSPEEASPGPLFVVGSMRSGSTMLRLVLDSHPHIAIGGETGFMGAVRAAKDIPNWTFGKGWYERLGWSEDEVNERLRSFYGGMFQRFAAEQGKPRWGEKTPFHTSHMAEMSALFPDAQFLGIVRHPGAVAASLRKKFHFTFSEALAYWTSTNLDMVEAGSRLGDRFALCRYEDLVVHGEPVLREILDFLGESWSPDVLEHHRVQKEKGAPRTVEGSTRTQDPIDARRAAEWSRSLSGEDVTALRESAELAAFFGYDAVAATPDPLADHADGPARWIVDGDVLDRRRKAWGARVDFDHRPRRPEISASYDELAARVVRAEEALARVRSRRAVRFVDAARKVQHGRSWRDVRIAWSMVRAAKPGGGSGGWA